MRCMQQLKKAPAKQAKTVPVNAAQPKASASLTVAAFLLEQLAVWGVKRIYGVIGDANLHVLDELAKQDKITYVACRHEESAALMASAEAKLTGRVGVCLATSGPGIANLVNGLADAAMDRVPVLALTGQVDTDKIGTRAKQYVDQQKLLGALTDSTELVAHPDALPELLQTALTNAVTNGKLAHLAVPKDLYTRTVKGVVAPYPQHLHQQLLPPEHEITQAADMLRASTKPVLLVGRGARAASAGIIRLAKVLSAAVVTTLPARPQFPNDHELYAGGLGQAGSEASSKLMAESDLIVMLGATWWPDEYVPTEAKVLQIDKTAAMIGQGHPLAKGIVGDIADIVPKLVKWLDLQAGTDRTAWKRRVGEVSRAWNSVIEAEAGHSATPLAPQRVVQALSQACADDAVITLDTGDHTLWFNRGFQAKPGQDILISGRWRTLGWALPAAIAAKLEQPLRQAVALAGDGGVVQTLLELHTAVQYGAPIVLVVMNNSAYAMEKNRMISAGMQMLGSELSNPDFVKLAEGCGAAGFRVETVEEIDRVLRQALDCGKPALVDVKTAATVVPHTKI
ncbi:MAG: pyruvate oxidase [Paenibacillus sp.]|nr:pyruvate oxidase [Paenibacillus sp.]